jgi:hypothetical protein
VWNKRVSKSILTRTRVEKGKNGADRGRKGKKGERGGEKGRVFAFVPSRSIPTVGKLTTQLLYSGPKVFPCNLQIAASVALGEVNKVRWDKRKPSMQVGACWMMDGSWEGLMD